MFGIILSALMLVFGIFLQLTKDPGFAGSKKFAWMFMTIGLVALVFKMYMFSENK
ncbi:hypothetical protein [Chryseobacterium hagamense]|uniref:Uncharacterized protein n=1 Tax=Chryseobacterium hagamense TaxID=395935 RepID=A0A511YL94_9FLAO|nr:hypothetical protein [Chryseobacterium hagamense]GEN75963.1 hypothetical protein CHA01nite_17030 [Chryseobacterium hagamense]